MRSSGPPSAPRSKAPAGILGWVALGAAVLFALVLLGTLAAGGTDVIYGATMLVLQLVVGGVIVAALLRAPDRMLGAIALVITLVFNVATVGGMSALQSSATGSYDGRKTDEQRHAEAYPGIKGTDPQSALTQPSLEQVQADAEALMTDVRARLSDEFGYTWVPVGDDDLRPQRNGYGGESMLVQLTTRSWATEQPIQDYDRKREVMAVINQVVIEHGMYDLYSFNESANDPSLLTKLYGSDDPRTQHTWESYTEDFASPLRFYADIYDLSNDQTGGFLAERQAQSARTGEPLEGLQLTVLADGLLSEADREEFQQRIAEYPSF